MLCLLRILEPFERALLSSIEQEWDRLVLRTTVERVQLLEAILNGPYGLVVKIEGLFALASREYSRHIDVIGATYFKKQNQTMDTRDLFYILKNQVKLIRNLKQSFEQLQPDL